MFIEEARRTRFVEQINNAVLSIMRNSSAPFVKAELFGFFIDRLVNRYLIALDSTNPFNAAGFNPSTRKGLEDIATKLTALLNRDDPMASADELAYIVATIWTGVLGNHEEVPDATQPFYYATRGVLEQIISTLNYVRFANEGQNNSVVNLRRAVIARAVLNTVVSRCTNENEQPMCFWSEGKVVTA